MGALKPQGDGVAFAAARILLERKNRTSWSNRQLAELLGLSLNTVDRYLHGDRVMPLTAFYDLSALLDLDPARVLHEAEARAEATKRR